MKNYLCDKKDLQDYNHLARMVRRKEKKRPRRAANCPSWRNRLLPLFF